MRFYEPIAGIEGVAAGANATVKVPNNRRLMMLRLTAQGTNAVPATVYGTDVIEEVFVYVGGKLQRNVTGPELVDIANLNGRVTVGATDPLCIFFAEPWRASVMDEQVSAWDVWGVGDITLKVKIKAALTALSLRAVMAYDDGFTTNGQGQRVRNIVRQMPFNFNAGSQYDITALDLDKPIQRIYLYPEAAKSITAVKVTVNDSTVVHEMTAAENAEFLEDYGLVYTPGAGVRYPLCFDIEQQIFNALAAPRSLRVSVTMSAAGAIKAVLENRAVDFL